MNEKAKPENAKPKKKQAAKHVIRETISLRHDFDQKERNQFTDTLTKAIGEKAFLELQLAGLKSDYKAKIELCDATISSASGCLTSGYEMRTQEVRVVLNRKKGVKEIYFHCPGQKNHDKLIRREDMTQGDYQRLPIEVPESPKPKIKADDKLVADAVDLLRADGKASVSLFQRRLKLGYAEAAALMDELERRKIVGPAKGAEPRDILKLPEAPPVDTADLQQKMQENQLPPEEKH